MVNSNMVNSKFQQFEVNLTGILFEVSLIRSFNSKFVVIRRPKSNSVVIQTLNSKFYVIRILCIRTYSVNQTCFGLFRHMYI